MINVLERDGPEMGSTIFTKICKEEHPSIFPASYREEGISSKNDFISHVARGYAIAEIIRTIPVFVSYNPSFWIKKYMGIIMAISGTIRAMIIKIMNGFFHL
jgi:hypothetical protein